MSPCHWENNLIYVFLGVMFAFFRLPYFAICSIFQRFVRDNFSNFDSHSPYTAGFTGWVALSVLSDLKICGLPLKCPFTTVLFFYILCIFNLSFSLSLSPFVSLYVQATIISNNQTDLGLMTWYSAHHNWHFLCVSVSVCALYINCRFLFESESGKNVWLGVCVFSVFQR